MSCIIFGASNSFKYQILFWILAVLPYMIFKNGKELLMETTHKPGRPKRDDLKNLVKCTVDDSMASAIKQMSADSSKSQAEILREILPIISSKDFENAIPYIALEKLQNLSESCWTKLHEANSIFETDKISDIMPAFITTWNPPMIHVKYPTYKINIFCQNDPTFEVNLKELERILSPVSLEKRSQAAYNPTEYLITNHSIAHIPLFVSEIMCLNIKLDDNIKTKNEIVTILNENNYAYSVYSAYCLRYDYIELLADGKYFKIQPQK